MVKSKITRRQQGSAGRNTVWCGEKKSKSMNSLYLKRLWIVDCWKRKKGLDLLNVLALSRGWLPPSWLTVSIKPVSVCFQTAADTPTDMFSRLLLPWWRILTSSECKQWAAQRQRLSSLRTDSRFGKSYIWGGEETKHWFLGTKTKACRFNQLPLGKGVGVNKVPRWLFK